MINNKSKYKYRVHKNFILAVIIALFSGCDELDAILSILCGGPAPPVLISPKDGEINVSLTPTLKWSPPGDGASVQVSEKTDFKNTAVDEEFYESLGEYAVLLGSLKPGTKYYWHVSISDTSGWSAWSHISWFKTK